LGWHRKRDVQAVLQMFELSVALFHLHSSFFSAISPILNTLKIINQAFCDFLLFNGLVGDVLWRGHGHGDS
jgi:hypothetical protein